MNAVIITDNAEERTLLARVIQQAGLTVRPAPDFTNLLQSWDATRVDLVIVAQSSQQLPDAIHQLRLMSAATIIVIADFVSADVRGALYEAGADLVLVRPYSQRLLILQAGIMAQQGCGHSLRQQLAKRPMATQPVEPFITPVNQARSALLYS